MLGHSDVKREDKSCERKLKISIEGNIASGKSSLLCYLANQKNIEAIYEPLDEWQDLDGNNLIAKMYEDPKRWGYLFQSYVLLTMMKQHQREQVYPISFMERSIFSARYCFVENLHKNHIISDSEYSAYCAWYRYIVDKQPPKLDLIVYLYTTPETCLKRIQQRSRTEEKPVTLEYLDSLHKRYEQWLGNPINWAWHGDIPVLIIDGNSDCFEDKELYKKVTNKILAYL